MFVYAIFLHSKRSFLHFAQIAFVYKLHYDIIITNHTTRVKEVAIALKRTYTFKFRLLGLFFIWIAIPLILLSSILSFYFNNLFIKESDQLFSNTLYSVSRNLQLSLDELKRLSLSPHVYDEVMEPLIYINKGDYIEGKYPFQKFTMTRDYTQSMLKVLYMSRNDVTGVLFIPNSSL